MNHWVKCLGPLLVSVLAGCGPAVAVIGSQLRIDQYDYDGDGYVPPEDCDDINSSFNPAAVDVPDDGLDQDCNGFDATTQVDIDTQTDSGTDSVPVIETGGTSLGTFETGDSGEPGTVIVGDPNVDDDGDGLSDYAGDCDDGEPLVRAGFAEVCDGLDNDCDQQVDDGVSHTYFQDLDGDGYGDDQLGESEAACAPPPGYASGGDCDDSNAAIYPGAFEPCAAGPDHNCDGSTAFEDLDGDGWISCVECDDADPTANPYAPEVCDGLDNDCDRVIDNGVMSDWHPDCDLDSFGDPGVTVQGCSAPANFVADDRDCNDSDPLIKPTAAEVCDESDVDEDCDGQADDLDNNVAHKTLWLQDKDSDGFGNEFVDTRVCDNPPANFIPADSNGDGDEYNDVRDCDDTRSDIYPGAPLGLCDPTDTGLSPDFNCDGAPDCP